jgi:hypothetical protein
MVINIKLKYFYTLLLPLSAMFAGCEKMVEASNPTNELRSANVFASNGTAESAGAGMYSSLYWSKQLFQSSLSGITGICGDEMKYLRNTNFDQYMNNVILPDDNNVLQMWTEFYSSIYQANSVMEGVNGSTAVSDSLKKRLTGEAKFIRAFCHFYLVNLWGDVPLIMTTDVSTTSVTPRDSTAKVYRQIVADLQDAQSALPSTYNVYGGDRSRATKWSATALLARVYLYMGNWAGAEEQANALINNTTLFGLTANTATVTPFLKNSNESIWQFFSASTATNGYAAEGGNFVTSTANYVLRTELYNAFETGDKRKTNWTRTITVGTVVYPQTYKYRLISSTAATAAGIQEFPTVLRLGEQYLIRAEARAQQNNVSSAQADLNVIRARAGLGVTPAADQATLLTAVEKERQVELFCEFGHRWLDLKRTNRLDAVMKIAKPTTWTTIKAALFPVPQTAINTNPNLSQNP